MTIKTNLTKEDVEKHIQDQVRQFFNLSQKASIEKSNIIKYLNLYDAFMRLATIDSLKTKQQLLSQDSPHKDARLLMTKYDLKSYDLQKLTEIRHRAKKDNQDVSFTDINNIQSFVHMLHQILSTQVPALTKID